MSKTNQQALDQLREYCPEGYIAVSRKEEISWEQGLEPEHTVECQLYDGNNIHTGETYEECFYYLEKEAKIAEIRNTVLS